MKSGTNLVNTLLETNIFLTQTALHSSNPTQATALFKTDVLQKQLLTLLPIKLRFVHVVWHHYEHRIVSAGNCKENMVLWMLTGTIASKSPITSLPLPGGTGPGPQILAHSKCGCELNLNWKNKRSAVSRCTSFFKNPFLQNSSFDSDGVTLKQSHPSHCPLQDRRTAKTAADSFAHQAEVCPCCLAPL